MHDAVDLFTFNNSSILFLFIKISVVQSTNNNNPSVLRPALAIRIIVLAMGADPSAYEIS